MQIINITNPREPRKVATFDCKISQGDIQVWKRDGRVLASYTADGTVGADGAASTCGRDLDLSADDAGTVLVDLTIPTQAVLAELPRRPARLAQHDDPPERPLPLQLQLGPADQHRADASRSTT